MGGNEAHDSKKIKWHNEIAVNPTGKLLFCRPVPVSYKFIRNSMGIEDLPFQK